MVLKVSLVYFGTTLLFCAMSALFGGLYAALSCLYGALLGGANMAALAWAWGQIIFKKNIALAVGVIVFKYAILGALIYLLIVHWAVNGLAFFVGLSVVIPAVVSVGIFKARA